MTNLKLYKISQNINNDYDTYSDAIVCAHDENEARRIHPRGNIISYESISFHESFSSWCDKVNDVIVEYIGNADKKLKVGVICASFHAG